MNFVQWSSGSFLDLYKIDNIFFSKDRIGDIYVHLQGEVDAIPVTREYASNLLSRLNTISNNTYHCDIYEVYLKFVEDSRLC